MNILIIHNYYSVQGGEESVVEFQKKLLEEKGHCVELYTRNYHEMKNWKLGKMGGMFTAIYNSKSFDDLNQILDQLIPEVAILHNLYPIISPAIIPFLENKGIRVYQVVHNYRLFCPIGIFYNKHRICHKCLHAGREWNCLIHNCNKTFLGSFSFALRTFLVRKLNYFKQVSKFLVLSEYQKKMIANSYLKNIPIEIVPNAISIKKSINTEEIHFNKKVNIGFVGRLNEEKGFHDFIKLAELLPNYEFHVAGRIDNSSKMNFPPNLYFEGFLDKKQLEIFYENSKVIVVPSKCLETFGLVIVEAFSNYTPVIASNIGGMVDIVEHGKNGYLVNVGDINAIKNHILELYNDESNFQKMALNSFKSYKDMYSSEIYYERLMLAISE